MGAAGVVANPGLVSGSGTPSSNTGMQFILLFVFYPLPASPGGGAEFPGSSRRFLTAVQEAERFFWGPLLLTFHRAMSKPLLVFTQKMKVGVIQPAPTFLSRCEPALRAWVPGAAKWELLACGSSACR